MKKKFRAKKVNKNINDRKKSLQRFVRSRVMRADFLSKTVCLNTDASERAELWLTNCESTVRIWFNINKFMKGIRSAPTSSMKKINFQSYPRISEKLRTRRRTGNFREIIVIRLLSSVAFLRQPLRFLRKESWHTTTAVAAVTVVVVVVIISGWKISTSAISAIHISAVIGVLTERSSSIWISWVREVVITHGIVSIATTLEVSIILLEITYTECKKKLSTR